MSVRIEAGCPYISAARAKLLAEHLADGCDVVMFVDDDLEWWPKGFLRVIEADAPVCGADYRFKRSEEAFMGVLEADEAGFPIARHDGCLRASRLPGGFLKVTAEAVRAFSEAYPELRYGDSHIDLFNHGAIDGCWYGEDFAFCKRWIERCGDLWAVPDVMLLHFDWDSPAVYPSNLASFLRRQPGGSEYREAA